MVHQLEPKKSVGTTRASRLSRCPQHSSLRGVVPLPRRQPTSRPAPHAHLSLASGVPLVIGWSHNLTSGAYHGASLWFTTLCALSVALGALSYNLMAVLAEFFNFDRRAQQVQSRTYLHGVDVTSSRFFQLPSVLAAVAFAAEAHAHQRRKTGEPYVTHCIETALIVEACLPLAHSAAEQERHVSCIMAAVLHDVIDDTPTDLSAMQQAFGPRVTALVNQVSKLSQMNQLLRRGKRQGWAQYSPDHLKQLRKLIVDLAFEEPLVILVKLADRLHNMRTVYVLPPDKQRSVAEETLEVWCSMAESLGWDGLKSEMEDLCFAVLQPSTYCTLRAELDRLWSLPTLAVVEEQLEDQATTGGGGGGGDDLGLRIVQVSGPEAPVRHYTRAAGVRAAAAAAAGAGSERGVGRYSMGRQRRLRRDSGGGERAIGPAAPAAAAVALDRAARAAVAATAVLPPPAVPVPVSALATATTTTTSAALAVPATSSSSVAVLEPDSTSSSSAGQTWGTIAAARETADSSVSMSAAAAAVAVTGGEPSPDSPRGCTSAPGGDGGSSHADADGASMPTEAPAATAAAAASSSSSHTSSHMSTSVRRSVSAATSDAVMGGDGSRSSSFRLNDVVIASGGAGGATPGGVNSAAAARAAVPAVSYGTLESVDGPILLDNLVLPFELPTAMASSGSPDGSSSYGSSTSSSPQPLSSASPPPTPGGADAISPAQPPAHPVHSSSVQRPLTQPMATGTSASVPSEVTAPGAAPNPVASTPAPPPPGSAAAACANSSSSSPLSDQPPPPPLPLSRLSPQQERLKLILSTVVPFESVGFKTLRGLASSTRLGLEVLDECAALLYNEIQIRSQAGGLGINIQGRLKSLHSVYRKMIRKGVAVAQVYDSRALRVIVDDGEGSSLQEAVEVCYRLVGAVHSIWKPIKREFDDYIANPKQSEYQALHTAVRGPGGIPMEVQIKTSSMHELAEYGAAAHWVYKEYTPILQSPGRGRGSRTRAGGPAGGPAAGGGGGGAPEPLAVGYVGQPVLKVSKDKLRYGVVISRQDEGQRLIVAIKSGATFRPFPTRVPEYGFYSGLLSYALSKGWQVPGHGDLVLRLEEFVKCDDGRYHRRDHLGYLLPAETVTLLEGYEEDVLAAAEAERAAAAAAEAAAGTVGTTGGRGAAAAAGAEGAAGGSGAGGSVSSSGGGGSGVAVTSDALRSSIDDDVLVGGSDSCTAEQRRLREQMRVMFVKTQQLRSMIAWGEGAIGKYAASDYQSDEVSVLIWPGGRIEHFSRGTTAGDIVAEKGIITTGEGYDGYRVNLLINVNNRLVPEDTVLNDGDLVILAREKVRI